MMKGYVILLVVGALYFQNGEAKNSAAKLALLTIPECSSHYFNVLEIGEEMASRGHEVSILTTSYVKSRKKSTVKHIEYDIPNGDTLEKLFKFHSTGSQRVGILTQTLQLQVLTPYSLNSCFSLVRNKETLKAIQESDMIVTGWIECGTYLADIFDKPFILVSNPGLYSWFRILTSSPIPRSYVPSSGSASSDEMNFLERTTNFLFFTVQDIIADRSVSYYFKALQAEYGWKSKGSFGELMRKAAMFIVTADFAYEYSYPFMPDIFFVGPILPKPPSQLPKDIEDFMSSSGDDGVVLVSFGSMISNVNEKIIDKMLTAISRLKQKVIWKARFKENRTFPANLKVLDWVPQNDILGHSKTKAFVGHMGINGACEAAFHGVPIVGACIFLDNYYNAAAFAKKTKMMKYIDIFNADSDTWQSTIEEIIYNASYKENAMKTSKLLRSWPKSSVERAGDLIQYAIDNGGRLPHLKSYASNLYWFQYHCLDVIAFLLTGFVVVALIFIKVLKLLSSLICNRKKAKKD